MLHGHFHIYAVLCTFAVKDIFIQRRFAFIQIGYKLLDTALIVEGMLMLLLPLIMENDFQIFCKECSLPQAHF